MKFIILILSTCILICCNHKKDIELPSSDFHNFKLHSQKSLAKLTLKQINNDSLKVIYGDSAIYNIDSNLHFHLFKQLQNELNLELRFNYAVLNFDKKTPFNTISIVLDELSKIELTKVVFLTTKSEGISIRISPGLNDNSFIHSYVAKNYIPFPKPPKLNIDSLLKDINSYHLIIKDSKIKINNNKNVTVNLEKEILKNEKYFFLYELNPTASYQDFISIYGFIFNTIYTIRKSAMEKNILSEQEAKKKYPIRIIRL